MVLALLSSQPLPLPRHRRGHAMAEPRIALARPKVGPLPCLRAKPSRRRSDHPELRRRRALRPSPAHARTSSPALGRGHVHRALYTHAQPATSCSLPRPRPPSACTMLPSCCLWLSLACLPRTNHGPANERCTSQTCKPSGCLLKSFNQAQANLCAHASAWPRQARMASKELQHHASLLHVVARAHILP